LYQVSHIQNPSQNSIPETIMVNQEQDAANAVQNRGQRPQISDDSPAVLVQLYNALGIQPGLPNDAGNENQGTPNNPPGPNQPRPAPDVNTLPSLTSDDFLTTLFPQLDYRLFTIEKRISSAEWVLANRDLPDEMRRHDIYDVNFRKKLRHRIAPELWPVIPSEHWDPLFPWLTPSQKSTIYDMFPFNFQSEITFVEEHVLPPHPHEQYLRTMEEALRNLPAMYSTEARRIKVEINNMFACHQVWMHKNKTGRKWLVQERDRLRSRTISQWINSWSGRTDGVRPQ
jgi:hypothetical protein